MVALSIDHPKNKILVYRPNPGKQEAAHRCGTFEMLFGGAAGPGKTMFLVMEALRQINHPRYNGLLIRGTYSQLEDADGIIARSKEWYPAYGGTYNNSKHIWTFPSGAHIFFRSMDNELVLSKFKGAQYQYVGFDELTDVTEKQYLFLFSRCRTDKGSGLRAYIRSTANPNGRYVSWVKKRFVTQGIVDRAKWFARIDDVDTVVDKDFPNSRSRMFIPATHKDNPLISDEYIAGLHQMSELEQKQLIYGDWDAISTDGVYDNFSSILNVSEDAEYNPAFGYTFWGVDDGYARGAGVGTESYHPRVILIGQHTPLGGVNIFFERVVCGESDYNTSINAIIGDLNGNDRLYPNPEIAYVDSSAAMFRGALNSRDIVTQGATHKVSEGIKNVRRMICDGYGMRLLKIHPRCQNLIEEMANYKYANTGSMVGERTPEKINDHGPDAARYMCWHMRIVD